MKFICLTDYFKEYEDTWNIGEQTRIYDEIEAESRSKAKWKFIRKHFAKRRFSSLPKISVKKYRPAVLFEEVGVPNSMNILSEDYSRVVATIKFADEDSKNEYLKILEKNNVETHISSPIDVSISGHKIIEDESFFTQPTEGMYRTPTWDKNPEQQKDISFLQNEIRRLTEELELAKRGLEEVGIKNAETEDARASAVECLQLVCNDFDNKEKQFEFEIETLKQKNEAQAASIKSLTLTCETTQEELQLCEELTNPFLDQTVVVFDKNKYLTASKVRNLRLKADEVNKKSTVFDLSFYKNFWEMGR